MAAELTTEELLELCSDAIAHPNLWFYHDAGPKLAHALKSRLIAAPKPEPAGTLETETGHEDADVSSDTLMEVLDILKYEPDTAQCKLSLGRFRGLIGEIFRLRNEVAQATPAATLGAGLAVDREAFRSVVAKWDRDDCSDVLYDLLLASGVVVPLPTREQIENAVWAHREFSRTIDNILALLSPSQAQTNPTRKEGE